jgi:copper chaperone CopZ
MNKEITLFVEGLDCEEEARLIRVAMDGLKGILSCEINIMGRSVKVSFDEAVLSQQEIIKVITFRTSFTNFMFRTSFTFAL